MAPLSLAALPTFPKPSAPSQSRPAPLPSRDAGNEAQAMPLRETKDRGMALLAQGYWEAALQLFQEVVRAAPHEPSHHQKVAELLQRLGRTQEAIVEYSQAAESWAKEGRLLRAIALCKLILQLDETHTATQSLLADLQARQEPPRGVTSRPVQPLPPGLKPARARSEPASLAPMAPIPLFASLGREMFLEMLAGVERSVFQRGERILQEGAPGSSMFVIVEGEVNVVRQGQEGQPLTVATLGEGGFFGEMALLYPVPRLASVVAGTRTVLLEFSRERMEDIATRYPQVAEVVQRLYQGRLLANVLRSNLLFAAWPEALQRGVAEAFTPVAVPAGEELLTRGHPAHQLYFLLRGHCTVFHKHLDGHETAYPGMNEGAVFGEVSLLRSRLVTASVRTTTPCVLLKLEQTHLERLLMTYPALREELRQLGAERLLRTTQLLSGQKLPRASACI
ncbi:cyclic nucleotide-binding domain-containing protein [Stigmatella aurantiaca]|uniref:Cyclic nucleotide-binding domain protein n=1 Tax=Stigmatella aurantiaca (strain DW4/3-1) TaxID=378806 RepID=Q08V69_STIAD|nr:cyclic nucleotide-binding domain-containing protein [Stigmatella aurantiaca]ADO74969.1 Cyclic nucleotide-binding domain protein [Stigmatella aurantiaca DW4/3-1]EAU64376.1 PKA regulatory subunit-like protein [Stigmatella aurantiaca DW4/3-1]